MRMDPTDIADVTSDTYTYLMNGQPSGANWTALFHPGERVRLRFIDAGAMTYFDVRLPGLKLTVVQVDGQNVQPVVVDEFRIAPGQTYDVIVEPVGEQAYTIFAETMDRGGYVRGTLAPRQGMNAALPKRRVRPIRSMADMGMAMTGMAGMAGGASAPEHAMAGMVAMSTPADPHKSEIPGSVPVPHGPDTHGVGNSVVPMSTRSRLGEPGNGLENNGRRVLLYTDLQSLAPQPDQREPGRVIEMHLTGNMERYMWSFDGKKYSEAKTPIPFHYGERLRLTLVNDTMMEHPIHLHGMWMELENGTGQYRPRLHTVNVKPAERLSVAITADAPGRWAMHCHLLLHMEMGMFRVVEVSETGTGAVS
jgi:CopA family copper-resistance protein